MIIIIASRNMRLIQTSTIRHPFGSGLILLEARPSLEVTYSRQAPCLNSTHASAEVAVTSSG